MHAIYFVYSDNMEWHLLLISAFHTNSRPDVAAKRKENKPSSCHLSELKLGRAGFRGREFDVSEKHIVQVARCLDTFPHFFIFTAIIIAGN